MGLATASTVTLHSVLQRCPAQKTLQTRAGDARILRDRNGTCLARAVAMPPVLVKHIMSAPVIALFAEQSLPLADDIMRFKHLRHLPVIDEHNHLVGMVSHRDILRAQISALAGFSETERRARQDDVKVMQIMTRDVWTVSPETLASKAGTLLLDHPFGCLPVVDAAKQLIGIVTEHDYLRLAIKAIELHDGDPSSGPPADPRSAR
ncbi:MAG: CBS domain-containing protein [Kofleriaceae bacterium]